MPYAGLDLSRKRLDVHVMDEDGSTVEVTAVRPDADALRTLTAVVSRHRQPVTAVVESMNGARFVHDQLERWGWDVALADAVRAKGLAPLAAKTDKRATCAATENGTADAVRLPQRPARVLFVGERQEDDIRAWYLCSPCLRDKLRELGEQRALERPRSFGLRPPDVEVLDAIERPDPVTTGMGLPVAERSPVVGTEAACERGRGEPDVDDALTRHPELPQSTG